MLKMCKFTVFACSTTKDLQDESDEQTSMSCTSHLQIWHKKGGGSSNIAPEPVMEVIVSKTKVDDKKSGGFVKSLLYDPRKISIHDYNAEQQLKGELKSIDSNMGLA
jgi:hypothetical protein